MEIHLEKEIGRKLGYNVGDISDRQSKAVLIIAQLQIFLQASDTSIANVGPILTRT